MFQTFEEKADGSKGPERLAALRAGMVAAGLDAFIVPRADAWQGEYVAPCDERLAWLTGFTGSAGFCAVLADQAGVFVDGRYRVQVRDQVADVFTPVDWPEVQLGDWLTERLSPGAVVGFDPWLHTVAEVETLRGTLEKKGLSLRPTDNLIDPIWPERPAPPDASFFAYPIENAGETSADKRARLAKTLSENGQTAALLCQPDSIAWLLNIRGADIEKNPVPQSFAVLRADGTCALYARDGRADAIRDHLGAGVTVHLLDDLIRDLAALTGPVLIDPKSTPRALADALAGAHVATKDGADPCALPKARKNPTELKGMREAHLRDGAAMCRFLHWLSEAAPKGTLTEIDVVTALEGFRRDTNALLDISFDTIAGTGPNGAIMHYRVTNRTNRMLKDGDLIVVDSGGQYIDGTTDITRTMGIGTVGADERRCYTRVLQGMVAISRARFPKGVGGQHLDALARAPLWADGMDFDHGTGHGVGVYLCVHEGPQGLSRRSQVALEPGMILSNEPGYYRNGAFGIRIENLVAVTDPAPFPGGDAHRALMGFETLTFVPLDRGLIDASLLSPDEKAWIDAYHADTLARIGPRLDGAASDWLKAACAPL